MPATKFARTAIYAGLEFLSDISNKLVVDLLISILIIAYGKLSVLKG